MRVLCAPPLKVVHEFGHHPIQKAASSFSKVRAKANRLPPRRRTDGMMGPLSMKAAPKSGRMSNEEEEEEEEEENISRWVVLGGLAFLVVMGGGGQEAHALEGPVMEEFWDNVRRYGLYILTVSTGAIYTIFQPIVELLKNPITAILILTVLAGGFYLMSLVLNAMFGISDFAYNYG